MQRIITFTSDMGTADPYVAALELHYYKYFPELKVLHLNHNIEPYDRLQAAHHLRYLYNDFPLDTIHVLAVGNASRYLFTYFEGAYILAPDNGLIPLITDTANATAATVCYEVPLNEQDLVFPLLALTPSIRLILPNQKAHLEEHFQIAQEIKILKYPFIQKNEHSIIGEVLHIDNYDNLLTNIHYYDLQNISSEQGSLILSNLVIRVKRLFELRRIYEHYDQVPEGEIVALFNHKGFLEIAFNGGQRKRPGGAAGLLGVKRGDKIRIDWQ